MSIKILGISCYYHDSAASLLENGEVISAVQEERFSRKNMMILFHSSPLSIF